MFQLLKEKCDATEFEYVDSDEVEDDQKNNQTEQTKGKKDSDESNSESDERELNIDPSSGFPIIFPGKKGNYPINVWEFLVKTIHVN